jgi:outer membrane immunogenic protein
VTHDKAGWTAGGGIEARLLGNLTGKIEYLYLDFGSVDGSVDTTTSIFVRSGTVNYSSRIQDHVVRLGLNYLFNGSDPVSAGY